jgi:ubiquinone/menaquinone biosynthesis C-methylase UbiE
VARYDEVADFYEIGHPDSYDTEPELSLFHLAGPVMGLRLLDLACGHGRIARELARRGARVIGIDISEALLAKARAADDRDPLGIAYVHADAASPRALDGEVFDGVVSSFGLSDIDDLDGALATVARVLNPGAYFVFSILHPCFPGRRPNVSAAWPPDAGYYREGWWASDASLSTLRQKVGANHRMLSTYMNALNRHALTIEQIAEPEPSQDWLDAVRIADPVPVFLVCRCRKQ